MHLKMWNRAPAVDAAGTEKMRENKGFSKLTLREPIFYLHADLR